MTLPGTYTTSDWYFGDANHLKDGGNRSYAAIGRNRLDDTQALIFYVKENGGNFNDMRAQDVTLSGSISYMKSQMSDIYRSIFNPYYYIVTSGGAAHVFQFKLDSGTHTFLRYDLP